jgi:hypothetical protein
MLLILAMCLTTSYGQSKPEWRQATSQELELKIPPRVAVERDRIEVEMRTASGIVNQRNQIVAGVVLITAGYAADGKYSHFLLIQEPLTLGGLHLAAGNYVFGWLRKNDELSVTIYDAASGVPKGTVLAKRKESSGSRVESFRIWPPDSLSEFQIGRFYIHYSPDAIYQP